MQLIINQLMDGRNGCYIHFDRATQALIVYGDGTSSGFVRLGPSTPGLRSAYCQVLGTSTVRQTEYDFEFSIDVSLTSALPDKPTVFAAAEDRAGLKYNWQFASALPEP